MGVGWGIMNSLCWPDKGYIPDKDRKVKRCFSHKHTAIPSIMLKRGAQVEDKSPERFRFQLFKRIIISLATFNVDMRS